MASISISEKDFETLASAALDAKDRGDIDAAKALDRLARKTNAALSNNTSFAASFTGFKKTNIRWQDVPSVIGLDNDK